VMTACDQAQFPLLVAYQRRDRVLGPMLRAGWQISRSARIFVRPFARMVRRSRATAAPSSLLPATARALSIADVREMAGVARSSFQTPGVYVDRNEEFLRWRLFSNPRWEYEIAGVESERALVAWIALRRLWLGGFDAAAVVDLVYRRDSRAAAARLLRDCVKAARASSVQMMATFSSWQHPVLPLLIRRGFLPGPHRFRILTRTDDAISERIGNLPWFASWIDTDHL